MLNADEPLSQAKLEKLLPAWAKPKTHTRIRKTLMIIPFVLCAIALAPTGQLQFENWIPVLSSQDDSDSKAEDSKKVDGDSDSKDASVSEDVKDNVTLRLIPDQKALLGATVTTIDLEPLLQDTNLGKSGEEITVEVRRGKKDVAEVTVDGMVLTLNWKKKIKKRDILIRASVPSGEYLDTKFYVELWEPNYWKLFLTVLGGLGLFLLGMKNMSEGLQAIAGNGLRKMIGWVTDNRFLATIVGTLITMLVQSSSITTVTVVGFVNSGFMNLRQAIGVIMGANIGTTITGWVLVLKIGKYGLPIAGAAAFFYLFTKRDRVRYLAMTIMGLGLIFLGLELMKNGFSVVKDLPEFEQWFQAFSADTYLGILKCALVGCVLTFIVQSSSATLGITIGLAQLGVIEFETAAALVLGENIGTTITAWLASFGATTNAKRAAYFHCIFNVLGVLWITAIFHWYLMLIRFITTGDMNDPLTLETASAGAITFGIAATHTGFNIANTLFFLPFVGYFAKFLERVIPAKKSDLDVSHLTSLDVRMLETPSIAIEQSRNEVIHMLGNCQSMMKLMFEIEKTGSWNASTEKEIFRLEDRQDEMQIEMVQFMSSLLGAGVPNTIVDEARHQLRLIDESESISDCIASVFKSKRKLLKRELIMGDQEKKDILELHLLVSKFLDTVYKAYEENDTALLGQSVESGEEITKTCKTLAKNLLKRLPDTELSPFVSTSYSRQIGFYRRVRDHLINISEVLKGEK